MADATPNLRACFGLSPSGLGLAVASALLGTILGSSAAGQLADRIGRRQTISAAGVLYALAILAAVLSGALMPFALCRFLAGVAIGMISVVVPMYLAEIAPPRVRGRIVGLFQLSVSAGVVAAFLAGYGIAQRVPLDLAWRMAIGAGIVPALAAELCVLLAPDRPRWLVIRGGVPGPGSDLNIDTAGISASGDSKPAIRLFSRPYRRPIALAVSIAVFNQLTGVNALLYYVLDIFRDLGAGRLNGPRDAIVLSATGLVVTILAVFSIDRIGRKPLLLAGAAGMGICLLLLPAIRHFAWPVSAVVVVYALYNVCFGFSQGTVIWIYLSEIFPLPVRARGQSLGTTVHWVTNAFVVGAFPVIASHLGDKVFLVLALLMVLHFLTILLFYPETKGRALESPTLRPAHA